MFPGEADAAEDLDAVLGVVHRVVQRERGGGRGGERVLVGRLVGGAGGVPGQGGGAFGPAGHGGAQVLDRLERADRAAELAADPGVPGRGLAAPGGDACGFGGEQGGGQVADAVRAEAGAETPGRDRHAVEPDGGQVAGEVDRGEAGDGDAGLVQLEDEPGAVLGAGEEGAAGRQDRAGLAGHAVGAGQRAGGERDRGRFPGQEAGEHGGQDRARGQRAGQRLQRGGQVGDRAVPRDGEDAQRLQVVHERGDVLPGADGGDGAGPLGPVAEGCLQGLLLLSHRDRQSQLPSV